MGSGLKLVDAPSLQLDLGQGRTLQLFGFTFMSPEEIVGGLWRHPDSLQGFECTAVIYFDVPTTESIHEDRKYLVRDWDHLTMGKRITCYHCGHVGYIKKGLWEPWGGKHE